MTLNFVNLVTRYYLLFCVIGSELRMENDMGKLFVGGISWETNEDRLREYFSGFGEVVEAVIMKDRNTGRARGFGFIVFAEPAVAERVVLEKHTIDGRLVEAKKAVPRDDQSIVTRSTNSVQGSPGPVRTKKIFVGGLASTVTEADFKEYFDQFGTITDVVVMYDHNTQRPRGFGFITYDSEDAVDKVLVKTFHELNGKMVEVKRAVPKELSPGPSIRSPIGGYNYGINRINGFLGSYAQGPNMSSIGSYGMRVDGRYGSLAGSRNGFPSFSPSYGIGLNLDHGVNPLYRGNSSFANSLSHGRGLGPYFNGNSVRYPSSIGYSGANGNNASSFSSLGRNVWGDGSLNYTVTSPSSNSYITSGGGSLDAFGNNNLNWGRSSSPLSAHGVGTNSSYAIGNLGYGSGDNNFGLSSSNYGRNTGITSVNNSISAPGNRYQGNLADTYNNNLAYGDVTWRSQSSEMDGADALGYGLGSTASDVGLKGSPGYISSRIEGSLPKEFILSLPEFP